MLSNLHIAILAGLAGMLGWGGGDFFAKKTIDKIGDMATLAWAHIAGTGLLVLLVAYEVIWGSHKVHFPTKLSELSLLAFFGALQAFVYFFAYRAFGKGKLSIINPLFSSYSGIVVILSLLLFGEVIGAWQLVVLAVVFLGIMTVSLDEESLAIKKLKLSKLPGVNEVLVAAGLAALWTVLWGHFVASKDWLSYAATMYFFMTATVLVICKVQKINLRISDRDIWKYFSFIGLGEVLAYVGISVGYSLTSHVSIVAVLSAGFSVPTLILAYAFLKERINTFQKAGICLVVLGSVLLAALA